LESTNIVHTLNTPTVKHTNSQTQQRSNTPIVTPTINESPAPLHVQQKVAALSRRHTLTSRRRHLCFWAHKGGAAAQGQQKARERQCQCCTVQASRSKTKPKF